MECFLVSDSNFKHGDGGVSLIYSIQWPHYSLLFFIVHLSVFLDSLVEIARLFYGQLGFISWDVFLNAIYTSCYQLHTLWWIINIPSLLLVSGFPHFFGQISLCPTLVSYIIELYFGAILTFLLSYCGRVFTTLVKVHTFQELALNDSEEGKFVIVLHISHLCIWVRITCGGKVMYLTS